MKAFLLAVLGALVIAGLSAWALSLAQRDASVVFTRESVRLDQHGHGVEAPPAAEARKGQEPRS